MFRIVMAVLVPAIHAVNLRKLSRPWMPGTRACPGLDPGPGMTDGSFDARRDSRRRAGRALPRLFVETARSRDADPRGRAEPRGLDLRFRRGVLRSRAGV